MRKPDSTYLDHINMFAMARVSGMELTFVHLWRSSFRLRFWLFYLDARAASRYDTAFVGAPTAAAALSLTLALEVHLK